MSIVKNPIPVSFTPDKITKVVFEVPCIVGEYDVKEKLDSIATSLANAGILNNNIINTANQNAASINNISNSLSSSINNIVNNITNVSSSISASIDTLVNIITNLSTTIPVPAGPTNAIQYKTGTNTLGGIGEFKFNPSFQALTLGTNLSPINNFQSIVGFWNENTDISPLFIVANGTNNSNRKNIFTVGRDNQISLNAGVRYKVRVITEVIDYLTKNDYYIHAYSTGVITQIFLPVINQVRVGTVFIVKVGDESTPDVQLEWGANQYFNNNPGPSNIMLTAGQTLRIIKWQESGGNEYWETW